MKMQTQSFYEPHNFNKIFGQSEAKKFLKATLLKNDLPNVCLFIGPPGVGITATAKCYSRAVNCENLDLKYFITCGTCSSCKSDHSAIKAPKYSSPDSMDQLGRNLLYAPRYHINIVIIDEVHVWKHPQQDRFFSVIDNMPKSSMLILTATIDTNTIHKIDKIFTHAMIGRCNPTLIFKALSEKSLTKLIKNHSQIRNQLIPDHKIVEIVEQSNGSAREAFKKYQKFQLLKQ
jgi:DNA polymerase-3 subunit gamma/tau